MSRKKLKSKSLHCPVCDSDEIFTVVGGYAGNIYRCKVCGYQGALVVEHDNDLKDEFKEALNLNRREEEDILTDSIAKPALGIVLIVIFILALYLIYIRF
ncbi:MAG: hypothetical protein PHP13_04880 [Methanomicrobium sp.]|nr:hypothetical protein [Methanomicrobium sp.]MDD4300601.1 hypothetical protein [Methanomicrobium sp.]